MPPLRLVMILFLHITFRNERLDYHYMSCHYQLSWCWTAKIWSFHYSLFLVCTQNAFVKKTNKTLQTVRHNSGKSQGFWRFCRIWLQFIEHLIFGASITLFFWCVHKMPLGKKATKRFKRFATTVANVKLFRDSAQSGCNLFNI